MLFFFSSPLGSLPLNWILTTLSSWPGKVICCHYLRIMIKQKSSAIVNMVFPHYGLFLCMHSIPLSPSFLWHCISKVVFPFCWELHVHVLFMLRAENLNARVIYCTYTTNCTGQQIISHFEWEGIDCQGSLARRHTSSGPSATQREHISHTS